MRHLSSSACFWSSSRHLVIFSSWSPKCVCDHNSKPAFLFSYEVKSFREQSKSDGSHLESSFCHYTPRERLAARRIVCAWHLPEILISGPPCATTNWFRVRAWLIKLICHQATAHRWTLRRRVLGHGACFFCLNYSDTSTDNDHDIWRRLSRERRFSLSLNSYSHLRPRGIVCDSLWYTHTLLSANLKFWC